MFDVLGCKNFVHSTNRQRSPKKVYRLLHTPKDYPSVQGLALCCFQCRGASALLCTRFKHSQCFPNTSSENSSMPDFCAPSSLSFLTTVNNWAFVEKKFTWNPIRLRQHNSTFGGTLSLKRVLDPPLNA